MERKNVEAIVSATNSGEDDSATWSFHCCVVLMNM